MECFGIAAEMGETRHRTALPRKGQRSSHPLSRINRAAASVRLVDDIDASSSTMDILHSLNRGLSMSII